MLESIITSKAKRHLLALFFTNPKNSFYLREICRKIGGQTNEVSAELRKMEKAGILNSVRRANSLFYSANQSCPIYSELKSIIIKTEGLGTLLKDALGKKFAVKFAFIYGSYAKGEEREGSDIDIMVIGKINLEAVAPVIRDLEKQIGRDINCSIYPEEEFLESRGKGFIIDVLKGKKIMLIGGEDELERTFGGRKSKEGRA